MTVLRPGRFLVSRRIFQQLTVVPTREYYYVLLLFFFFSKYDYYNFSFIPGRACKILVYDISYVLKRSRPDSHHKNAIFFFRFYILFCLSFRNSYVFTGFFFWFKFYVSTIFVHAYVLCIVINIF